MNDQPPDPGQKRPPTLIDQAKHAADALVNEVQHRMPPELLSQLRAGQRQIDQRVSRLQSQLGRSASRAEVDRLARRVDELAAQLENLARAAGSRAARPPRRDGGAGRGPRTSNADSTGRGPRSSSTSSTGRGPRTSSKDSTGGSKGPRASSPPGDKPSHRSTRGGTRHDEGDAGSPPRRSPRSRPRKPPEATD